MINFENKSQMFFFLLSAKQQFWVKLRLEKNHNWTQMNNWMLYKLPVLDKLNQSWAPFKCLQRISHINGNVTVILKFKNWQEGPKIEVWKMGVMRQVDIIVRHPVYLKCFYCWKTSQDVNDILIQIAINQKSDIKCISIFTATLFGLSK